MRESDVFTQCSWLGTVGLESGMVPYEGDLLKWGLLGVVCCDNWFTVCILGEKSETRNFHWKS